MGGELRVDHLIVVAARRRPGLRSASFVPRRRHRAASDQALIHLLQLSAEVPEPVDWRLLLERLPGLRDQRFRPRLLVHWQGVAALVECALHRVGGRVEFVAHVGDLAKPPILVPVPLSVGDHPLDLGLVQVGAFADGDPLLGSGVLVPR